MPQQWTTTPITAEPVRGAVERGETERVPRPHRLRPCSLASAGGGPFDRC